MSGPAVKIVPLPETPFLEQGPGRRQPRGPPLSLRTPPSPALSFTYPTPASPFAAYSPPAESPAAGRSSPPPTPADWHWKCHRCGHAYRLACTPRCLDCGHRFCGAKTPGRPSSRRRRGATCAVYFDLDGWEAWGLWRRTPGLPGQQGDDDARAALFDAGAHDCLAHCDYPSQCLQMAAMRRRTRQRETEDRAVVERRRSALAELAALSAAARMGADAVSPIESALEQGISWLSSSSSSSEPGGGADGIVVECFEDAMNGDLGVRIVDAAGGAAVFCGLVSPVSPAEEMGDAFWGSPCNMNAEEWKGESSLRQSLGHAETRPTRDIEEAGDGEEGAQNDGKMADKTEGLVSAVPASTGAIDVL